MNRKIPPDAFEMYLALGAARSYQALALKCGVNKRSITKLAAKELWQERIVELERKARERTDVLVVETIAAMQQKHLKTLQVVLGKALEALRAMPLESAMEAVRSIDIVLKQERCTRGGPLPPNVIVEADLAEILRSWLHLVYEHAGREKAILIADGTEALIAQLPDIAHPLQDVRSYR